MDKCTQALTWSYSSVKQFQNCPKQDKPQRRKSYDLE